MTGALAERIAEATRAEAAPRQQVQQFQALLDTALAAGDYAAAAEVQGGCIRPMKNSRSPKPR